jgi:fused signal recognition particle receptor
MQTAKNLMDEINKIVQVVKPDMKIFIGDSLAGNDAIFQATEFYSYTKFDGAILTKIDTDSKGGSIISISYLTSKPIMYLGVGQDYDDIIPFNINQFIETLFNFSISPEITNINTNSNTNSHTDIKTNELSSNNTKVLNGEIFSNQTVQKSSSKNNLSGDHSSNSSKPEITAIDRVPYLEKQYYTEKVHSEISKKKIDSKDDLYQNSDSTMTKSYDSTLDNSKKEFSERIESDEILDPNSSEINKEKKKEKKGFFTFFGKQKSKNKEKYEQKSTPEKDEDFDQGSEDNKNVKKDTNAENDVVYLTDDDLDEILKE